jgi:hypothetical protein
MGILFTGYLTAVSFALELMYGIKNSSDLIGKVSLAECALLLSLMVGYFVFLLLKPEFFGEFTDEFKKDRVSSKYYNFMLFERVLVGSCLVFMLAANIGAVVPLAVFMLTGIFIAVRKPYRENYHCYPRCCEHGHHGCSDGSLLVLHADTRREPQLRHLSLSSSDSLRVVNSVCDLQLRCDRLQYLQNVQELNCQRRLRKRGARLNE